MNAPVWQHPTSLSPPTVSIRQILRCLSRLLAIKSDILSNLMEINSYCVRPAGCWEQNEVSYYLETQILKKILPCATPGATRLSLTRSVVMEPSPSEIKTHLNKNKTTNCRIGLSRNFTDYFSTLYKYEELFSCLANNTELFTRLTEMRQENPEQKVLRGEQCHIFINSDIHFNERSQIILSQDSRAPQSSFSSSGIFQFICKFSREKFLRQSLLQTLQGWW